MAERNLASFNMILCKMIKGGYRFGGNPEEIFEKFFGASNPFQ